MNTHTSRLSPDLIARVRREVERLAVERDVDDLTQEACARIIAKEHLWKEERGEIGGWVSAVARNVVRNRWRRQAKEIEGREVIEEKSRRESPDPFSEDRIAFVLEQFAKLPDDEQRILRWRYLEERSVDDIALKLAVSQPTASRRIQEALKCLRRRAHAAWLAPAVPVLQFLGVHKMKAAVLALTVVAAASTPSWFEPDQEAELVAPTAKLANTHFVAGLSAPLKPSENTIWCASGPLAWKELESFVGGPVQLTRESKTVDQLNESPFRKGQVDPSAYVAGAGVIGDGIVARLQGELEAKFGRGPDPVLARLVGGAGSGQLLTYAFLFKQIKWRVEFASLQNPISFRHSAEGTTKLAKVRSFGLKSMGTHQWCDQLARQVRIFGNSEEFAVELSNPKEDDSVILARIPPGKTLSATVQRALKLLKRKPKYLETQDTLQIPVLDFDLSHTYSDVNGGLENPGFESKALGFAIQTVRLRLDEKGAMLKSRFAALAGAPMPMKPKQLIFDRPFLILMKEKGFDPYLAIWVASPEILVPAN